MRSLEILVVGAGIGGLTAALACSKAGHRVTVLESARELRALGVGINVLPHAVAVLAEFGLLDALRASGIETEALVFANRFGQTIHTDPRGVGAGAGHPQISIHRGALHAILADAVHRRLGPSAVRTGQRVVAVETTGEGNGARPAVRVAGADGDVTLSADVIVAADGIHSAIRAGFYPDEGPPRWNGVMMWRGTTVGRPFLNGRTMVQAGTSAAKFVVYPISRPHADRGEALINWVADIRVRPAIEGTYEAPARQDWMKPGNLDDLLAVFGSWCFDWLDVPGVIRGAGEILEWPMVDRDPLPRWVFGGVALLGDAAHPMYPIGSNGATQAILDAACLARALADRPIRDALAAYEAERLPMTRDIVQLNRKQGIDAVMDQVDALAPGGFAKIEDVMDPARIAADMARYKAAAGHRMPVSP